MPSEIVPAGDSQPRSSRPLSPAEVPGAAGFGADTDVQVAGDYNQLLTLYGGARMALRRGAGDSTVDLDWLISQIESDSSIDDGVAIGYLNLIAARMDVVLDMQEELVHRWDERRHDPRGRRRRARGRGPSDRLTDEVHADAPPGVSHRDSPGGAGQRDDGAPRVGVARSSWEVAQRRAAAERYAVLSVFDSTGDPSLILLVEDGRIIGSELPSGDLILDRDTGQTLVEYQRGARVVRPVSTLPAEVVGSLVSWPTRRQELENHIAEVKSRRAGRPS